MFGKKSNKELKAIKRVARLRLVRLRYLESHHKNLTPHTQGRVRGQIEAYEEILEVLEGKTIVLFPKE